MRVACRVGGARADAGPGLLGPTQYVRTAGPPNVYNGSFSVPASAGAPFQLRIVNGAANGQNRISSGWVKVNGVQVVGPADFGQNVALIERDLTLSPGNTLEVQLASAPGGYITLSVLGTRILPVPTSLAPNPLIDHRGCLRDPHGHAFAVPDAGRDAVGFQRQCNHCDGAGVGGVRPRAKHSPDPGHRRRRRHHDRHRER